MLSSKKERMRNLSVLKLAFGLLLAMAIVACARTDGGGGGGVRDGNPVGFDLTTKSGGTVGALANGCLSNGKCKFVEVYYLTSPPPACPTNQTTAHVTCDSQNKQRALPTCPANARCVKFSLQDSTAVEQDDDNNLHPWPSNNATGLLVFSATPPKR